MNEDEYKIPQSWPCRSLHQPALYSAIKQNKMWSLVVQIHWSSTTKDLKEWNPWLVQKHNNALSNLTIFWCFFSDTPFDRLLSSCSASPISFGMLCVHTFHHIPAKRKGRQSGNIFFLVRFCLFIQGWKPSPEASVYTYWPEI